MAFVQNFPFFSIIMCLAGGVISSILPGKYARRLSIGLVSLIGIMTVGVLVWVLNHGSYTFMMGHFPAPWGNEIRAGVLEAVMALCFCIIMLLSVIGGARKVQEDVEEKKVNLYYVMIHLMMSSLLALIYTNDLFTAYVFVEINTIAACAIIMIRNNGHTLVAATKYMIMSLLGSGLLLISLSTLYSITGHLLMSNIKEQVTVLAQTGEYAVPLTVIIGLLSVGLAIKSALFPFHSWLPDAYSYSTPSSSAILSSLVSKGYIFLLIKVFYRVIGFDVMVQYHVTDILFVFGVAGMIIGSVSAIKERDLRRMIAYSSVAQIGYIYMGMGLGIEAGMVAAVFHMISHAASKSMLFISANGLSEVSGGKKTFRELQGSGLRSKAAGCGFTVGALSMVGIPLFAGFTSKVYFAEAAITASTGKMAVAMIALAISTILNAVYFLRAVVVIYMPKHNVKAAEGYRPSAMMVTAVVFFILLNLGLGTMSNWLEMAIRQGLAMFG